jgi:hypothetical protein
MVHLLAKQDGGDGGIMLWVRSGIAANTSMTPNLIFLSFHRRSLHKKISIPHRNI